ncbi:M15 family metallopeptidase [Streptomyces sp. NPDC048290]|uniref:M15 family metallopeptidase n=1 Tax=Streptomyces sp. NPDC048290 TaxID=3155811 RepID=UPI00343C3AAA
MTRFIRTGPPLLLAALLSTTACTAAADTGSPPSPTPTLTAPPPPSADAAVRSVPDEQWQRMKDAGMVRAGCPVTSPGQLRRVEINHYDFDGEIQRGVLVVNADIAESTVRIFTALFDAEFPIKQMKPLEEYGGDNTPSLADDNTASFNCRRSNQINAPALESPHANGRAIDINPLENPWMDLRCKCWKPSAEFSERTEGKGKILEGDQVWQLFIDEGWIWQNIDVPDYMHFDTGYPSKPFTGTTGGTPPSSAGESAPTGAPPSPAADGGAP